MIGAFCLSLFSLLIYEVRKLYFFYFSSSSSSCKILWLLKRCFERSEPVFCLWWVEHEMGAWYFWGFWNMNMYSSWFCILKWLGDLNCQSYFGTGWGDFIAFCEELGAVSFFWTRPKKNERKEKEGRKKKKKQQQKKKNTLHLLCCSFLVLIALRPLGFFNSYNKNYNFHHKSSFSSFGLV